MDCSASPGQRVSLFRRGFWKKNLACTVQVAIMCHARKKAPCTAPSWGSKPSGHAWAPTLSARAY